MKVKRINKITVFNILISITAFLQLQPYFIWRNNLIKLLYTIILFFVGYFLIISKSFKIKHNNLILLLFSIFLTIYINYGGIKTIIINLIFYIPLFVYIITSTEDKKKIYNYFTYIFAIALLPGIILYIFNLFNINFKFSYLEPLNPLKTEAGIYYKQYFGAITLVNPHSPVMGKLYRLCAMFDEPGVVGTIAACILAGNRYQISKSNVNKILFLGGILSFSLFFYIISLGYYFISAIIEKKYKKIIVCIAILGIFGIFSTGLIKNDFININIVSRITIKDGKLQGNNRTTDYFEARFEEFLNSGFNQVLFGMGRGASSSDKLLEASASWKKFVFDFGFVGFFMLILFLCSATFMFNKTTNGILLLFVMLACIYQRPGVFDLPNLIIFFGGLIVQAPLAVKMENFKENTIEL